MKSIFKYLLVFSSLLGFFACSYDAEDDELIPQSTSNSNEEVSYQIQIKPIIETSCATNSSCHAAGSSRSVLTSYAAVKVIVDNGQFRQRVLVTKNMPKNSSLSNNQLDLIQKWLDEGAKNN